MHRVRSVISATPVEHGNESADPASWQLCSMQAPIALALIVPEGMAALSNMPGSEPAAVASSLGLQQITFAATPNMSTYLLAICVGHIAGLSTLSGESCLDGNDQHASVDQAWSQPSSFTARASQVLRCQDALWG